MNGFSRHTSFRLRKLDYIEGLSKKCAYEGKHQYTNASNDLV